MPEDLLQSVNTTLLPAIQPLGFEVVDSRVFDSFDNALVVLCSSSLRIRIARERGPDLPRNGGLRRPFRARSG